MVEWKKLGDICEVLDSQRKPVAKGNRTFGEYPYYGANGIQDYVDDYIFDGTFLLMGEDGSVINKDNSPVLHWAVGKIWVNNHAHILKGCDKALLRYLYYCLQCTDVSDIVRGIPPKINQANMRNILLPNPPLPEQQRIVDILDTFTSSIDNLKQQIAERRKQYEHYREKLMNVDEGPEARLTSLGEIGTFERGNGIQKKDFTEEGVGCIHYGQIHTSYGLSTTKTISYISEEQAKKCKKAQCGDIIIATTSEDVEGCAKAVAWMGNHEICISGDSLVFHHNENSKYIAYLFQMNYFQKFKRGRCTGAKVTRISPKALSDYPFVLPIRSMQAEIVSKLDNFENIIRNLEEQLKLREKQYEYYRNKLLTFK